MLGLHDHSLTFEIANWIDLIARQCTMWASVVTGCTLDVCGQYGVHVTYY